MPNVFRRARQAQSKPAGLRARILLAAIAGMSALAAIAGLVTGCGSSSSGRPAGLNGRQTGSSASSHRKRAGAALAGVPLALLLSLLLAACGSSSSSKPLTSAQVKQRTCKQVEAVLSDGPEPEADPVGYAQAQILPLRQIHTTNARLAAAIGGLASAYQQFTRTEGASGAKTAVNSATGTIKALCPGIEL